MTILGKKGVVTAADNPIIEAANPIIEELMPQCLRVKVLSGKLMPATTPASEIARITRTRLKKFLGSLIRPNYLEDSDNLVFPR